MQATDYSSNYSQLRNGGQSRKTCVCSFPSSTIILKGLAPVQEQRKRKVFLLALKDLKVNQLL